jgi:hypothetical protein
MASDAAWVLAAGRSGDPQAFGSRALAARVQVARRQLAPISGVGALADSFRREGAPIAAGDVGRSRGPAGHAWRAVRIAYAIRWIELSTGTKLPAWQGCPDSRAARV